MDNISICDEYLTVEMLFLYLNDLIQKNDNYRSCIVRVISPIKQGSEQARILSIENLFLGNRLDVDSDSISDSKFLAIKVEDGFDKIDVPEKLDS